MKYAEVPSFLSPSPAKHVSNGNAWAKNVVSGNDILGAFTQNTKLGCVEQARQKQ
ncbi:hypothetical protein KE480_08675 [Enterococcus sp. 079]|nr:hypothetical protein [Enterococcus sp. 079]